MKKFHPVYIGYAADEQGNIYGKDGRKLSGESRSDGYLRYGCGSGNRCYGHVFVYECFNGIYDRKRFEIDHINTIKKDNGIVNLKKMSRADHKKKTASDNPNLGRKSAETRAKAIIRFKLDEHGNEIEKQNFLNTYDAVKNTISAHRRLIDKCLKGIRSTHAGYKWRWEKEDINEYEVWCSLFQKELRGIEVSNLGRIKNKYGKIGIGSKAGNYLRVRIKDSKYLVHCLVCLAFHGIKPRPDMTVDHIDRKGDNNHENNLRWATRKQQRTNQERCLSAHEGS